MYAATQFLSDFEIIWLSILLFDDDDDDDDDDNENDNINNKTFI